MTVQGSTWNPADVATGAGTFAPNLSNGNLTITGQASSNNFCAIRATGGRSSGQFYFQTQINQVGHASPAIGIALSSASLASFGATSANYPGGLVWSGNGDVAFNGTDAYASWQTYEQGDILGIAVDVTNGLIWGQVNGGLWNNSPSASPSLGKGGLSFAALGAGTYMPVAWINDFGGFGTGISIVTGNFSFADVLPAESTLLQIWARVLIPIVNNLFLPGPWSTRFGNTGGPVQQSGGMPLAGQTIVPGAPPLYLTAAGTGDAGITLITGPPFLCPPPKGFAWGWPNGKGGPYDTFNPATAQGSASVAAGHASVSFPGSPGLVQGNVGLTYGSWYFEYLVSYDIFSENTGVGIGRAGADMTAWLDGGGFNLSGDNNGGAQINGGNITSFVPSINANRGPSLSLPGTTAAPSGHGMGIAVTLGAFNPAVFNAQQLQPVPMSCLPCRELLIGPGGFGGFGT